MSEYYTDDDVTAAAEALIDANHGLDVGVDLRERDARAVLDSVAPAIAARALREAADEVKWSGIGSNPDQYLFMVWLRARAEELRNGSATARETVVQFDMDPRLPVSEGSSDE